MNGQSMDLCSLESSSADEAYLPQLELYSKLNAGGVSVATARSVFGEKFGDEGPAFQLVRNNKILATNETSADDLLSWNWIPIFSVRARDLILSNGGVVDDFMACQIGGGSAYLHLPRHGLDVVDFERSHFGMLIPMPFSPLPLPHRIERLALTGGVAADELPSIFRPRNRHGQDFSELIATGEFEAKWDAAGLSPCAARAQATARAGHS